MWGAVQLADCSVVALPVQDFLLSTHSEAACASPPGRRLLRSQPTEVRPILYDAQGAGKMCGWLLFECDMKRALGCKAVARSWYGQEYLCALEVTMHPKSPKIQPYLLTW